MWSPFNGFNDLLRIMRKQEHVENVPLNIFASAKFIGSYEFSYEWESLLNCEAEFLTKEIIEQTWNHLYYAGFSREAICQSTYSLIAACIGARHSFVRSNNCFASDLYKVVINLLLAGYFGLPDRHLIDKLLDFSNDTVEYSSLIIHHLKMADDGLYSSKEFIVNQLSPYWKEIYLNWKVEDLNFSTNLLGFPFEYAISIENSADSMFIVGLLMKDYGSFGDDEIGRKLVVKSALLGSTDAWDYMHSRIYDFDEFEFQDELFTICREKFENKL